MTHNRSLFVPGSFRRTTNALPVLGADARHPLSVEGTGSVVIDVGNNNFITLLNVLYVPNIVQNLICSYKLQLTGYQLLLNPLNVGLPGCVIKFKTKIICLPVDVGGMWVVYPTGSDSPQAFISGTMADWHMRLGHPSDNVVKEMLKYESLTGMQLRNGGRLPKDSCLECPLGKQKRLPLTKDSQKKPTRLLELIHTDLMGPMQSLTAGRNCAYVLTFVDDASRYAWTYLLKTKSAAFSCFQKWLALVENQTDLRVKRLRSDNGGEFCSNEFEAFLTGKGILHEHTMPYTPQENGISERINQTLQNIMRCLLSHSGLPESLWGEAMMTACYLYNRLIHRALRQGLTPFEAFNGFKPKAERLHVFGAKCSVYVQKTGRHKLDARGKEGIFVGYADGQPGWRIWINKKVIQSRDVIFFDNAEVDRVMEKVHSPISAPTPSPEWYNPRVPHSATTDTFPTPTPPPQTATDSDSDSDCDLPTSSAATIPPLPQSTIIPVTNTQSPPHPQSSLISPTTKNYRRNRTSEQPMPEPPGSIVEFPNSATSAPNLTPLISQITPDLPQEIEDSPECNLDVTADPSIASEIQDLEFPLPVPHQDQTPRRSLRLTKHPARLSYDKHGKQIEIREAHVTSTSSISSAPSLPTTSAIPESPFMLTPLTLKQAYATAEAELWKKAYDSEMDSLIHHDTYTWVKPPIGARIIHSKLVFKIKPASDGNPIRFKVRGVACGYSQTHGIDYHEVFAPVVKYKTLRLCMALAAQNDWHIHKMDVKTAFLNGDLEEDIYMRPLPGQVPPVDKFGYVWKLNRSLYGLKQSPRCWNSLLHTYLTSEGFTRCSSDYGCYISGKGTDMTIITVYIDDLLFFTKNLTLMSRIKAHLSDRFDMVDFGEATSILGIKIARNFPQGTIHLSQTDKCDDLISVYGQSKAMGRTTPLEPGIRFSKSMCPETVSDKTEAQTKKYRAVIGSLMHIMVCTRPDIAAAVGILCRFMENPGQEHWNGAMRIIQYLKKTRLTGLTFNKNNKTEIHGFCDSDWAGDADDNKSTTGWVFLLAGGAVSWQSKKQKSTAQSSCEAEYYAAGMAGNEVSWLSSFLGELGFQPASPIIVYSDSQSAMNLAANPVWHEKSKHIATKWGAIRELIYDKILLLLKIKTDFQIADSLTKAVPGPKVIICRDGMGLTDLIEGKI
jgi:transposase InsO family protein